MFQYSHIFLIIAFAAGVLGFGAVAGTAGLIAKVCFIVFLVLFAAALLRGWGPAARARPRTAPPGR